MASEKQISSRTLEKQKPVVFCCKRYFFLEVSNMSENILLTLCEQVPGFHTNRGLWNCRVSISTHIVYLVHHLAYS